MKSHKPITRFNSKTTICGKQDEITQTHNEVQQQNNESVPLFFERIENLLSSERKEKEQGSGRWLWLFEKFLGG